MPAILKGFIERVLQPDLLAIQASGGKASWKSLKANRRASS
jgi:putative NADPH-quinone reductase